MALPQQLRSMLPLGSILRLGQLLVPAVDNHAHPLRLPRDFLNFDTDFGIRPHPFDLLSEGREDVNIVRLIRKVDRYHIRLVIERAAESSDRSARQTLTTLFLGHFIDHHDLTRILSDRCLCQYWRNATLFLRLLTVFGVQIHSAPPPEGS